MADLFSKDERSRIMAAVRGRGNRTTEMRLSAIFRAYGITGWRRHQALIGKPDFVFRRSRVAVFVDGCFWHGCRLHLRLPQSNTEYWTKKIGMNMQRDSETTCLLKAAGWEVLRIWEHELRAPEEIAKAVSSKLQTSQSTVLRCRRI